MPLYKRKWRLWSPPLTDSTLPLMHVPFAPLRSAIGAQLRPNVLKSTILVHLKLFGNSHGGTIPPRTPPGSAWVRAGPRRTPAESAKLNFAAEPKIPPRNPPRTRRTAAEQICSAADPIGSAADWRNFRRRNALKRVRASPPQGYSESVRRGLLKNFVFAELFRD